MSTQEPQSSLLFSALPPIADLVAFTFRVNSSNAGTDSAHSSVQQCCMSLAENAHTFLVSPVDQTSLSAHYSDPKKRLLLVTSCSFTQTEEYKEKLNAFKLTESCRVPDMSYRLFEECFRFTLCSRLSPEWSRFGTMLVQGGEFLQPKRAQTISAVRLETNIQLRELCISLTPYSVSYRPLDLSDVLNMSEGRLVPTTTESTQLLFGRDLSYRSIRCQVLPNLTRAYIHSIAREPLRSSSLQNHSAIRGYWRSVHGYQLPQEETAYVNVSFQSRSSRALTYPLPCVLTENSVVWRYSPASADRLIKSFRDNTQKCMPSFCGHQLSFSQRVRPSLEYNTSRETELLRANTQPYGTTPNTQPYGTTPNIQPYGTIPNSTQPYLTNPKPYGTIPNTQPYGITPKPYDTTPNSTQPYVNTPKPYDTTPKLYDTTPKPYGTTPNSTQPYGTTAKPYGTTPKPYGTTPNSTQPYDTTPTQPCGITPTQPCGITPTATDAPLTQPTLPTGNNAAQLSMPVPKERYKPCFKVKTVTIKKPEPNIQHTSKPPKSVLSQTNLASQTNINKLLSPVPSSRTFSSSLPPKHNTPPFQNNTIIHPTTQCYEANHTTLQTQPETAINSHGAHILSSAALPSAKKQKVSKPSVRLEDLATAGQLEKASIPNLAEWLREKKISFKSKDKKAQLVSLVRQHMILAEP